MNLHRYLVLLSLVSVGCGQITGTTDADGSTRSLTRFIKDLENLGADVVIVDSVHQPFFEPAGVRLTVDGDEIQAFVFATTHHADTAAAQISPDGGSVLTDGSATHITWITTPHFFRRDEMIVLYVGTGDRTLGYLRDILGPQFAGG